MITNADMTIVRKTYNTTTKKEDYSVTPFKGVFWSEVIGVSNYTGGSKNADNVTIHCPIDCPISKDDIVVRGLIDFSGALADLIKNHECHTVTSIKKCDYGNIYMQHLKVGAK